MKHKYNILKLTIIITRIDQWLGLDSWNFFFWVETGGMFVVQTKLHGLHDVFSLSSQLVLLDQLVSSTGKEKNKLRTRSSSGSYMKVYFSWISHNSSIKSSVARIILICNFIYLKICLKLCAEFTVLLLNTTHCFFHSWKWKYYLWNSFDHYISWLNEALYVKIIE